MKRGQTRIWGKMGFPPIFPLRLKSTLECGPLLVLVPSPRSSTVLPCPEIYSVTLTLV